VVEQRPMQEGRNMTMMLAPSKAVLAGQLHPHETDGEQAPHEDQPAQPTQTESAPGEPEALSNA
ncbi:MAG: hypothetical protein ACRDK2_05480, partial [Solirubrobacteraceae bacterium]